MSLIFVRSIRQYAKRIRNMKTLQKRSKALSIANSLKKQGWDFGKAQRHAWNVVRAIEAMKSDEIVIRFCKDGQEVPEQRTATLSPAFFNYTSTSTKTRKQNPLQVKFWDTLKNGWRSFNAGRFVSFKTSELVF